MAEDVVTTRGDPQRWSTARKSLNIGIVSWIAFVSSLAIAMPAYGAERSVQTFRQPNDFLNCFVISVYMLGFGLGPMLFSPLSEMYGRVPIYYAVNLCFIVAFIGCAKANSLGLLIFLRFAAGCTGGTTSASAGGTIVDLVAHEHRGLAMTVFSIGPQLGAVVGPIIGTVVTAHMGWRWNYWLLAALSTVTVFMYPALQETNPSVIARRFGKQVEKSGITTTHNGQKFGLNWFLRRISSPSVILCKSSVVFLLALYAAVSYGYIILMLTTLHSVLSDRYQFDAQQISLMYIPLGIGFVLGGGICIRSSDRIATRLALKSSAAEPEHRLSLMLWSGVFMPVGLLIYGWTTQYSVHWTVPSIGLILVAMALIFVMIPMQLYMMDAFTRDTASALAASALARSMAGAFLPLCGKPLYKSLGLHWGNSLLAGVALLLSPVPFLLMRSGKNLRERWPIRLANPSTRQ